MLRDALIADDRVISRVASDREPEERPNATPDTTSARSEEGAPSGFQPRVDAEEGDPTRGDYVIGALVVLVILLGLLWAFGVIDFG